MDKISQQKIVELVQGNPGGLNVVMALLKERKLKPVIVLDKEDIRGSDIWLLYKDCNNKDIQKTAAVLEDGSWRQQLEKCPESSFYVKQSEGE